MLEFQLFRLRVVSARQFKLFEQAETIPNILEQILLSKPEAWSRHGSVWHIGNVLKISDTGFYFRIGRATNSKIEVFADGRFQDHQFETAPYTHGFLDTTLELCVLAKKNSLNPTTLGIARQFAKLLREARKNDGRIESIEIDPVKNPDSFLEMIDAAYSVTKLTFSVSRPNHFNVDEDFIKPLERLLQEADADGGKAELGGESIDKTVVDAIAVSTASTGGDVSARIKDSASAKSRRIKLDNNPVVEPVEDITSDQDKRDFMNKVSTRFRKLIVRDTLTR